MSAEKPNGIEKPIKDQESPHSSLNATTKADSVVVGAADINVLILGVTLIKYLGSKKEKNKEKLKWLGH